MNDEQRPVDGSALFAQSTDRIEILFDHDRNGELLAEWVGESFDVETTAEPGLDESVDLCLVDAGAFARHETALRAWKRAADPVFAPVLLVSDEPVGDQFDPGEWRTIDGLYIVDDIIATPIEKPVLHRRLANLLERRTLSKRLDNKYRRSEERFASLFATLPDPALVTDPDGTLLFVNDGFCTACGTDREHAVGKQFTALDCLDDDAAATLQRCIARAVDDDALAADQIAFTTPDGDRRHLELNATATAIDDDEFVTVVLRDVTERVRQTERLAESEQRFRRIANHLNEVIWMVDETGELLYISSGYERLTGRPVDGLHEDPLERGLDHIHPEDEERVADAMESMFAEMDDPAEEYHFEYRLVDDDGTVRWVETSAYPISVPENGQTRIVGLLDDITERKRREHALERQNERLDEFAGIVSHDLRNPLQVIDARLDMLDDGNDDHVEAIERATGRMQRLIDDLLSLARQGETVSDVETVELAAVAELAWKSIDAPEATLTIESDIVIEADADRLRQLFENLYRNSVEHGSAGPTITVGALDRGFYVADDGPGIPEDQWDRVFEQGYSTQANGTGFGLNIVADIVAAHGWAVSVTDGEAGGARFEVVGVETYDD